MEISEIGAFGLNLVAKKARQLIGRHGFRGMDYEDLRQRMLADLVGRLAKFDPALSPRSAFITKVVNNAVAAILKQQTGPARQVVRNEVSLHQPLAGPHRDRQIGDLLADSRESTAASLDMAADLRAALAAVPADLRELWDQRAGGQTLTQISRRTGVPRITLHDRWGKLCRLLAQAGLGDYFA